MFTGELIMGLTALVLSKVPEPDAQERTREDNAALMVACRKAACEIFDAQRNTHESFPLPAVTVAAIIYRHVREMKEL